MERPAKHLPLRPRKDGALVRPWANLDPAQSEDSLAVALSQAYKFGNHYWWVRVTAICDVVLQCRYLEPKVEYPWGDAGRGRGGLEVTAWELGERKEG